MPTQDAQHALDNEVSVGHLLRRAYAKAKKNSTDLLREAGDISPIQAAAVAALSTEELSQAELGRRIGMEPTNIHGFVRRLEALKFVIIHRDKAPPKTSRIGLTDSGLTLATKLIPLARLSAERTLRDLTKDERRTLIRLLQKIAL